MRSYLQVLAGVAAPALALVLVPTLPAQNTGQYTGSSAADQAYQNQFAPYQGTAQYQPYGTYGANQYQPYGTYGANQYQPYGMYSTNQYHPYGTYATNQYQPYGTYGTNQYQPYGTYNTNPGANWQYQGRGSQFGWQNPAWSNQGYPGYGQGQMGWQGQGWANQGAWQNQPYGPYPFTDTGRYRYVYS
jgi:hypothetical protein